MQQKTKINIVFLNETAYNPLWITEIYAAERREAVNQNSIIITRQNGEKNKGEWGFMEEAALEEQISAWEISHPWLSELPAEEDDVDEVIRYTLDEIRFA